MKTSNLLATLTQHQPKILQVWTEALRKANRPGIISEGELQKEALDFYNSFIQSLKTSDQTDVKRVAADLSRVRGLKGFSPSETANFVLSMKKPLFAHLRSDYGNDTQKLADELWNATEALDDIALFTTEAFQKSREEVITRQQSDMLELSTPVVELWRNILALPMIGTLDSSRTQTVMETLLQRIVETGSEIAIIDITGVPTVDTLVAQHLLKTVTAARLMGAECIISGIRPQIAATIVHLGVDLGNIITKATLADAFKVALKKTNQSLRPNSAHTTKTVSGV